MRIQKIISHSGYCSRRKAESLIEQGRVKVNGITATIGQSADPDKDKITINNKAIKIKAFEYYVINKPINYLCTLHKSHQEKHRKSIFDLPQLRKLKSRIYNIGRLDYNTEGILILTNDGDFANSVMHPSNNITKTYDVELDRALTQYDLKRLNKGVFVIDRKVIPDNVKIIKPNKIKLTIHEGLNRIVKRMMKTLGYRVVKLKRTAIGNLKLGLLKPGEIKKYTKKEIENKIKD